MNNRKIFAAFSILLLAIIFITVGCGEGKHSTRSGLRKTIPLKPSGGGKPLNPNSAEAKEKLKVLKEIDQELSSLEQGAQVIADLEAGSYQLEEIINQARYMSSNNSDDISYLSRSRPDTASATGLATISQARGTGLSSANLDPAGRQIVAPLKLKVSNQQPNSDTQLILFTTKLGLQAPSMKLEESLTSAAAAADSVDLLGIIAAGAAKAGTTHRESALAGGKRAELKILKLNDNRVALRVAVIEGKNTSSRTLIRTVVFLYKVTPLAQAQQQPVADPSQTETPE